MDFLLMVWAISKADAVEKFIEILPEFLAASASTHGDLFSWVASTAGLACASCALVLAHLFLNRDDPDVRADIGPPIPKAERLALAMGFTVMLSLITLLGSFVMSARSILAIGADSGLDGKSAVGFNAGEGFFVVGNAIMITFLPIFVGCLARKKWNKVRLLS